jgi:hypothetical protein
MSLPLTSTVTTIARPACGTASADNYLGLAEGWGLTGCGKRHGADNHPGARRATPPDSGGELFKMLPPSDEERWRA